MSSRLFERILDRVRRRQQDIQAQAQQPALPEGQYPGLREVAQWNAFRSVCQQVYQLQVGGRE
jgi:hypothetical protein